MSDDEYDDLRDIVDDPEVSPLATTLTPILKLPYPASSDPVAQGASNIQALATAVDNAKLVQGMNVYSSYVPTLQGAVANPSLGATGFAQGRYQRVGAFVHAYGRFMFSGAGAGGGSGYWKFGLPTLMPSAAALYSDIIGQVWLVRSSPTYVLSFARLDTTNTGYFLAIFPTSNVDGATPWAWASGDEIHFSVMYETSSVSTLSIDLPTPDPLPSDA
jgi:hypothetical protein